MSFKNQTQPASIVTRVAMLQQQITRETYATVIRTVVQEILDRPPGPAPTTQPIATRD